MSLISNVLEAAYCSGTHHKLAFHSLNYLEDKNADRWRNLFLNYHASFIEGSKVPDKVFKDFKNHVLHVGSGNWGGAPAEAESWYELTVSELRSHNWEKAAFSAGVLSHYVTDPLMPFHTAQSEAESNIHRAVEWSVNKSYNSLRKQIATAVSDTEISPDGSKNWIHNLIIDAAEFSNQSYQILIDRYDFKRGSEDPPAGFDDTCREHIAKHLAYAQVLQAHIMDRAVQESGAKPPKVNLTLKTVLAALTIPIAWVTRKMNDAGEIKLIQAMYKEFSETGRVDKHLTEDVRVIRDLVTRMKTKAPREEPTLTEVVTPTPEPAPVEPALDNKIVNMPLPETDLRSVPGIGKKTAKLLKELGLNHIQDLLSTDPESLSNRINRRWATSQTVQDWQDLARLAQQLPQLRGHDLQILVGGGIRTIAELADSKPEDILANVTPFIQSEEGKRVVKPGCEPDFEEVNRWIEWAGSAA